MNKCQHCGRLPRHDQYIADYMEVRRDIIDVRKQSDERSRQIEAALLDLLPMVERLARLFSPQWTPPGLPDPAPASKGG